MNPDYEDRILEAGLEEIRGGHYPPDLSAKILQALEERCRAQTAADSPQPATSQPTPTTEPAPPIAHLLPLPQRPLPADAAAERVQLAVGPARRRGDDASSTWLGALIAGGLLAILISVGIYVARTDSRLAEGLFVTQAPVAQPQPETEPSSPRSDRPSHTPPLIPFPESFSGMEERGAPGALARREPAVSAVPAADPGEPPATPRSHSDMIAFVDQMLEQKWREQAITPAPAADDATWGRRVYQRLVGREPTAKELEQFVAAPAGGKRAELVDVLLASEEYARHWSARWAGILQQSETSGQEGLREYLFTALAEDKGYDQIAADLISAAGATTPEAEDYNPATMFLAGLVHGDRVRATDHVSRVFLGKQLICARCHDHPANGWDQSEFWELNAFFRQMNLRRGLQGQVPRLVDEDFYGGTGVAKDAEIFYTDQDGRLRVAYPRFGGQTVSSSGLVADVNRRQELARLIVRSPDFRTAVVNRVWAELLQYGFVEPVDDLGPHNPPSHPELLAGLGEQLAAHQYDLKELQRWIVLSKAFGVSDQQTPESWMDTPQTGGQPLFARFYAEPKPAADLYKTLMLAANSRPSGAGLQAGTLARRSWSPSNTEPPQIIDTQGAEAWAGPRWLDQLAASNISSDEKVQHLFLSVLGRQPNSRELMAGKLVLAHRVYDPSAVRELWQLLLTSRAGSRPNPTQLQPE